MLNVRFREKTNAWPGFVDLFSNLVIILIFLLIVFVFLWTTTNVFNKSNGAKKVAILEQTRQEQAEQIVQMTADKAEAEQLLLAARDALQNQESQLAAQQEQHEEEQQNLKNSYEQMVDEYQQQISELTINQQLLAEQITALNAQLQQMTTAKDQMARMEAERHEMQDDLMAEKNELNMRIAELEAQLERAAEQARQQDVDYIEMSNRLNTALAEKVAELNAIAQYQSEFYKQVKKALGERTTIKTDGDRFIVSSDILFPTGSYKISADGANQLRLLAGIIKDLENRIPTDIDWIIRVDGHTDNKPVVPGTHGYSNNMQLSLLRATAVANELVKNGVSKRRLVPSGFGELHPIELGNDPTSLQKNRRIELQLTNK